MSLYDREYYRTWTRKPAGNLVTNFLRSNGAVGALIAVNIFFYIASLLFGSWLMPILQLSRDSLESGFFWTLITYSFLHGGLLHLFCNMLGLYFIGVWIENRIGTKRFCALYFFGAILGAILWLPFASGSVLVGASAAVMAVFSCFCLLRPATPITFLLMMILPISLKPMTMLKIAIAFEVLGLLSSISGGDSNIAYSAHLGGILTGFIAVWMFRQNFSMRVFSRFQRKQKSIKTASDYKFSVNISEPKSELGAKEMSRRVDEILDKINAKGFSSLTDDERRFLAEARSRMG